MPESCILPSAPVAAFQLSSLSPVANRLVTSVAAGRSIIDTDSWISVGQALRLSRRELEIVQSVFDDRKEAAIGFDLGISPHTVNTHLQRVYRKVGVTSRAQLIVRVMAQHLAGAKRALPSAEDGDVHSGGCTTGE